MAASMKIIQELLERKQQEQNKKETVTLAGQVVSISQKPFVEQNILAARKVLHRLLSSSTISESNEISEGDISVEDIITISEEV